MKRLNKVVHAFLLMISAVVFAQTNGQTIGTETIEVIKLYSPTISDADKINDAPKSDTQIEEKKVPLKYQIFSYPVASTYSPSKGRAAQLTKEEREKLFANYLVLGFGNYTTPLLDFYTAHALKNDSYVIGDIHHLSSQGGIKDVRLDNSFYDTRLRATYGVNKKAYGWDMGVGYQHQLYNWYGIPETSSGFVFSDESLNQMTPSQTYQSVDVKGGMFSTNKVFKNVAIGYNHFWDAKGSAENRFNLKPVFNFNVADQKIKTDFEIDYVGGSFQRGYMSALPLDYSVFNVGFQPSIVYRKNDFNFNLGAGIFYSALASTTLNQNKLHIYPQVTGSYAVVSDVMIAFAGLEGGLQQNSYRQFVDENPFLSPTLSIRPTDKPYDVYIGLRGQLIPNLSYILKGFHYSENNKALFANNLFMDGPLSERQDYEFANSYTIVYDAVKTTGFTAEISYDLTNKFTTKLNGTFASYVTQTEQQAWNMPAIKGTWSSSYRFLEKWKATLELFYIGDRKDQQIISGLPKETHQVVSVKGYLDANMSVNYQYNKQLSGFLRLNNLTNQPNQRWLNYPTQQFQVLIGAAYKFDFK